MGNWKYDQKNKKKTMAELKEKANLYQKRIDKFIKLRDRTIAHYKILERDLKRET